MSRDIYSLDKEQGVTRDKEQDVIRDKELVSSVGMILGTLIIGQLECFM